MFTGLVEGIGKVKGIKRSQNDIRLTILPLFQMTDCRVGDSICVDGVCLTVADISEGYLGMDVSGESLSRSTLGSMKQGDGVNLERALRLSDRLGGHLVLGHVDGVGMMLKKEVLQRSCVLRIGIDEKLSRYTVEKGSIAIDGISLTINRCERTFFEVNIIPQTGIETTILKKRVGALVNIETDLIGKYVERFLKRDGTNELMEESSRIDREMLLKYGFGD